jgi:hypothetical protein
MWLQYLIVISTIVYISFSHIREDVEKLEYKCSAYWLLVELYCLLAGIRKSDH